MCHIHAITYETLMEDEENQVTGYVHFADGEGFGYSMLTLFTPREAVRIVKNGEVSFHISHSSFHFEPLKHTDISCMSAHYTDASQGSAWYQSSIRSQIPHRFRIEFGIRKNTKTSQSKHLKLLTSWRDDAVSSYVFLFQIHNNLDEVHKHIDKSLLPKEYGGEMSMAEMIST